MLFACLGISGLMCALFLIAYSHPAFSIPMFAVTFFSAMRYFHWRNIDLSECSPEELQKAIRLIRVSAFINAPMMSASAVYLIFLAPQGPGLVIAGWMAMMACITGISLCSLPATARATMLILVLPPNLALLWVPDMTAYLFGLSMILLSFFCMGTFMTVLKFIRSITNEAEENAVQRGWIAATMRDFLEMSQDVAWEIDERLCFTQLSSTAQALFGRSAQSTIGMKFEGFIDFSDKRSRDSSRTFAQVMKARAPFKGLVFRLKPIDGMTRYVRISGTPLFNHAGTLAGYRGLMSDITAEIESRIAMEASEARFRDFAELATERLWETDENLCFTYISETNDRLGVGNVAKLIGTRVGTSFEEFNTRTPEERRKWDEHFECLARHEEYRQLILRDGEGRVLSLSGRPIFNPDGTFKGYRGFTRDITEEYQARDMAQKAGEELSKANRELEVRIAQRTQELQQKTDLLQEIFDTMAESIVVLDEDMSIAMVNEKPGIALPPGNWSLGNNARDIYSRAYALGLYREAHGAAGGNIIERLERSEALRLNRIDTSGQHISEHFYPRSDGGYVILYTDITKEAKREEELRELSVDLRRSKEAAEAASRSKSEFLANMSHEIRTPMNGILGMTEILMGTKLSDKQREMTRTVMRSADSLLTIINDILDFSKLEAGKMTIVRRSFALSDAINDVTDILAPKADEKNIELNLVFEDELAPRYMGDVGRIRQVITNLVGNAVKFTEKGSVTLTVKEKRQGERSLLTIDVTDTGCGIPEDKLDRIFNKFEQVDGSSSRQYEGTGLGLSISRRIAEMMGGTITVRSFVGKGSTFCFTVPLPIAEQDADESVEQIVSDGTSRRACASGCRILIAEDNLVNQMVLKAMIEPLSCNIVIAGNGQEAVELFSTQDFDFVMMDVSMPVMDGLQATTHIKDIQARRGTFVPVIGITAHAMQEDQARCRKAGMDDYLPKPVRKEAVLEKITYWHEHKVSREKISAA